MFSEGVVWRVPCTFCVVVIFFVLWDFSINLIALRWTKAGLASQSPSKVIRLVADAFTWIVKLSSCQAVKLSSCQAVKLSSCQAVKLSSGQAVKLSSGQAVKPSSCQAVKLSSCQDVKLSCCQAVKLSIYQAVKLSSCQATIFCFLNHALCQLKVSFQISWKGAQFTCIETIEGGKPCSSLQTRVTLFLRFPRESFPSRPTSPVLFSSGLPGGSGQEESQKGAFQLESHWEQICIILRYKSGLTCAFGDRAPADIFAGWARTSAENCIMGLMMMMTMTVMMVVMVIVVALSRLSFLAFMVTFGNLFLL